MAVLVSVRDAEKEHHWSRLKVKDVGNVLGGFGGCSDSLHPPCGIFLLHCLLSFGLCSGATGFESKQASPATTGTNFRRWPAHPLTLLSGKPRLVGATPPQAFLQRVDLFHAFPQTVPQVLVPGSLKFTQPRDQQCHV